MQLNGRTLNKQQSDDYIRIQLHRALFSNVKTRLNQVDYTFLHSIWDGYVNVGNTNKISHKQNVVLKSIFKKCESYHDIKAIEKQIAEMKKQLREL
mgnify:CR=1 FL=1